MQIRIESMGGDMKKKKWARVAQNGRVKKFENERHSKWVIEQINLYIKLSLSIFTKFTSVEVIRPLYI